MLRVWGKLLKKHKIIKDVVVELPQEELLPVAGECIEQLCEQLDIPRPVILSKHFREIRDFNTTRFRPYDFMEDVSFEAFELELLIEKKKDKNR